MGDTANDRFPWKEFGSKLYDKAFEADIFSHSAQVAFYFSFALFPLLYFLVSLFGIVLDSSDGIRGELFEYLRQIMPLSVFQLVRRTVDEIVVNSSGGKATLGLVITLWSASAGIDAIMSALNSIYTRRESRDWWKTKLQSLLLTLVISVLVSAVLAFVFYGWQLAQYFFGLIGIYITSPIVLITIQWITVIGLMLFVCDLLFYSLPDVRRKSWRWISAGSVVAILLWLILTSGFRMYLGYFDSYNKAYGSLGAVMILMLWLYLTALSLMIGGTINSVSEEIRAKEVVPSETKSDPV